MLAPLNSSYGYEDINAFSGKNIGVVKGGINESFLLDYMESNNFEANIIYIDDIGKNDSFDEGLFDLRVSSGNYQLPNTEIVARLGATKQYLIGKQGNSELIEQLDAAIAEIYS